MVFKEFGKDVISLAKNYNTLNVMTKEQSIDVQQLVEDFNRLKNSGSLVGNMYQEQIRKVEALNNDNLTNVFQQVAEGAENARVNIVDAYAAILDGNTHGLQNVQSIMNTFNNSFDGSVEKQKEFTKAVGQSNKGLANYLNSIEAGGTATLKGYVGQLVKTTAQTVLLTAKTIALQAAISIGLSVAINGIIVLTNKLVNREKELIEKAKESSEKNDEQAKSLDELKEKYKEICDSADDEKTKNEELNEIKIELINTYKIEKENLEELNLEREKGLELLDEEFKKSKRNSQNVWLDRNKEIVNKANQEMASSGVDYFSAYLSENNISDSILKLFNKREAFGDTGYVNLEFDYTDTVDRLNKLKNIYNEILDIQSKRSLTADEQQLLSDVKTTLDAIQGVYDKYYDTYSKAAKYNVENIVENYLNTDEGKIENVGKDTFNSWSKGLLDQAKNAEQKRQLENYIEEQFPDLTKYFENLAKARQKFAQPLSANQYEVAWAKEKDDFLENLSPEDLEIATKIPDLFADGLDGATAKIEAWKSDPKNKITPDVEIDDAEISTMLETVSKKVKLITTAMEEQADTGYISSSTYADIIEMGGNFADCLEVQNGKLKLNVEKLKELEKQELRNELAEIRLSKASWETVKATKAMGGEDTSAVDAKLRELTRQEAVINQIISEITNAKPNESGSGGSSSNSDPWKEQFDKQYSEKQHLLAMEQLSEEDYLDWLDGAYKQYFSDLTKYQDEYYKYEEEVYKGRKQLAEDFYDSQRDYYKNRVSDLEAQIEITTKDSTDNNGNLLNAEEKFAYIRSVYSDILATIQEDINDIVQNGIEGHENDLKELEQQYEKYVKEMADIFKDEVESEIDYIQDLQDTVEQVYDDKIDKIEAEKKAMEDRYDAEIDKIDSVIDSLEKENDQKQLALNIAKAEKELAEARRKRNVGVLQANGTISYQADPEAITEAQNNLNELYLKRTTEALEQQKEILQKNKEIESDNYDAKINNLNADKDKWKDFYDNLVDTLNEYINPKQKESNSNVWNTVAGEDGAIKVGKVEMSTDQIDARIGSEDIAKSLIEKLIKASNNEVKAKELVKNLDLNNAYNTLWGNSLRPVGLAELQKAGMFNNVSTQNYVNNNGQTVNLSIGDITITNPVGNSKNLAEELMKKLPNAMLQQIYKVR